MIPLFVDLRKGDNMKTKVIDLKTTTLIYDVEVKEKPIKVYLDRQQDVFIMLDKMVSNVLTVQK